MHAVSWQREGQSRTVSLSPSLSQGPGPAGASGNGWPPGAWEGQGRSGPGRGGRWVLRQSFHMVGFAINFECLCGSIKFPMVVYREYESRKLVAKTG